MPAPTGDTVGGLAPAFDPDEGYRDLPARLRAHASRHPDLPALIEGNTTLTAIQLAERMDRFAAALAARRIRPGDVVATMAGVTASHVIALLGIVANGSAVALLPTSATPETLDRMIANSDAKLILADDSQGSADRTALSELMIEADRTPPAPAKPIPPETLFAIIYSSGTTGDPKGIEHEFLFRDRQIRRLSPFGFGPGAVSLVSTPIYSNTTLSGLLPALGNGSTIVVMEKFDELGFLTLAERHRVTHAMVVPAQVKRLLAHPEFDRFDLSSFQVKLSTSAPFTPATLREILDRWPGRMINVYGMTEGGVTAMLDAGAHREKLHTVGRASTGADLRVIGEDGFELPQGETGEIVGRAPTMMRRYRKAPKTTADAVWTSPDGDAFIRSGDVGRIDDDGFLTLLDRKKDVIISGGFNIFACDIEAILEGHPEVRDCAVIGVPSERWGETPVAFVTAPQRIDTMGLRDWANGKLGKLQRLADVRQIPELPRSSIGKILKRQLRDAWTTESENV